MKPQPFLPFLMVALFASATVAQNGVSAPEMRRKPFRVLQVVAHPDDEYEVAGTVYRISKELLGTVDQVVITDGEAGHRYSSLAVPYYGIDLVVLLKSKTGLRETTPDENVRVEASSNLHRGQAPVVEQAHTAHPTSSFQRSRLVAGAFVCVVSAAGGVRDKVGSQGANLLSTFSK